MPPPRIPNRSSPTLSIPTALSLFRRVVIGLAISSSFNNLDSTSVTAAALESRTSSIHGWDGPQRSTTIRELWHGLVRRQSEGLDSQQGTLSHKDFAFKLVLSILFVLLGGIFSGLSLGLMGLDQMNLKVLATSGSPQDRTDARKVLSLLDHGRHFVLVCLLLSNVIVNETLPIFLDSITGGGGILAVIISSGLIFFAGEVLPQSICSRYGLRIGAKCVTFVKVLMYLESPVCWPTAKLLDFLLGSQHSHTYRRDELKTFIELHSEGARVPASFETHSHLENDGLSEIEVGLVTSALDLHVVDIQQCMRKVEEVYTINDGMRIRDVDLKEVLIRAQQYVPVRRANSQSGNGVYVGIVTVEQLATALGNPNDTIRTLQLDELIQILPSTSLADCLAFAQDRDPKTTFIVSRSAARGGEALGFATVDDIARYLVQGGDRNVRPDASDLITPTTFPVTRGRASVSIGVGAFVRGIVERYRIHRASASELSFRLSSDSDSPRGYHPLGTSHSHHRTNSQQSSIMIPLTRDVVKNRPVTTTPRVGRGSSTPGVASGFKFPSPVMEHEDSFTIGDETDFSS